MNGARRLVAAAAGRAALPAMLLLAGGCGGANPLGDARPAAGTLVVAVSGDVDSWNPYTTNDVVSAGVLDLLYPRLVQEVSGEEGFRPWLARSWEFSGDRLRLTFHLQPAARWSDGTPVTCEDVRFTLEAQRSEALAWAGRPIKERILGVDCPDDHTAVFRFEEASASQFLDANDNAIVPAAYAGVPLADWSATPWHERIVTAGPYRLEAVRPGQEAVLVRDPSWWEPAGIPRIVLRVYPATSGPMPEFLAGGVDLVLRVPPLRADDVRLHDDLRLLDLPSLSFTYLGWNVLAPGAYVGDRRRRGCGEGGGCQEGPADLRRLQRERPHPVLADPRVRRALSLGIDRRDVVDGVWAGFAREGTSPVVSALWAHRPGAGAAYDPRAATALLDEAGWRDADGDGVRERDGRPLELEVIVNSDNRVRRDALARVAAGLERLGVGLREAALPRAEFVARARDKQFDAVLSGWWAGTRIQPQTMLHTRAAVGRGNNLGSWSTPRSDALLDRAAAATSREAARPLWHEWQALFDEQQPLAVLYEERTLVGLHRRVRGPEPPFLNPFIGIPAWTLAPPG